MSEIKQYVIFSLNEQVYGIEILKIKEVVSYRKITPLPNMIGFTKGIINLRGIVLPVFDLREKFNLSETTYTPFHIIIVMEISGRIMGVIVDEISDVFLPMYKPNISKALGKKNMSLSSCWM